jgi:hypothetical protein
MQFTLVLTKWNGTGVKKAEIYNLDKLNRKVIFEGLEHGYNTYPTDFDMVFNLRNEINIIVDAKEAGKEPVMGQTITYVNISKALEAAGVPSYVIWVEHSPSDENIKLADCKVVLIWNKGKFIKRNQICELFECDITYKELQHYLLKKHNVEPYNPAKHKFNKSEYSWK